MKLKSLAVATIALALTACGGDKPADTPKAEAAPAQEGKSIIITTESSFKPFSYLDEKGQLVGFEIDLANALCAEMKAQCKIEAQDWDGLIPGLQANKSDAIMAGMSATAEREKVVDFSDSYFDNTLVVLGKKGVSGTPADLEGKTIAAQLATVSSEYIEKNIKNAKLKTYPNQDNAFMDLVSGRADFMVNDIVPALDWLKTDAAKDFEVKGSPIDINDKVAIAVRKGDALKGEFNAALATLKANGKYDEIVAKYFDANVIKAASGEKPANDTASSASSAPEQK